MEYTVPGRFDVMAQPSGWTCWATTGAMMMNWRARICRSIGDAMSEAGSSWRRMFDQGQGLMPGQHEPFAAACRMRTEPLMCLPIQSWLRMLQRYGPLAVVTANPFHARIIAGITESGSPRQTCFKMIDPAGGRCYDLEFGAFTRDFEAVARSPRAQIWHY
jgi:hypothetical protein